jgi:hypothetical protein
MLVKRLADRVDNGILSAHVDVSPRLHVAEGAPEHDVFEVLGV